MVVTENKYRSLARRLGKKYWAYTGSVALALHAKNKGVRLTRNIGNINIAARNPMQLALSIPGNVIELTNKRVNKRMNNGTMIQVFKAGGNIAPSLNNVKFINKIPVVSISNLLAKKRMITPNKKTNENIQLLLSLSPSSNRVKRSSPSPSPIRRRNSPSSLRRRLF